ncbi:MULTISPECIES: hypothetical protein [unclassified Luteococcus]|uniref:hypothetical protein n=1 Tax=unclassified Luteococcus TaxID=2639923 RepID=UPI00313D03A0
MIGERDEDRRIQERTERAQRAADGNWSFTGPSSTLSMRQWREPSTVSSLSSLNSLGLKAPAAEQPAPANRPEPVQMPKLEDFDYDGDEGPMLPVERLAQPAPLLAPDPLQPQPLGAPVSQQPMPHQPTQPAGFLQQQSWGQVAGLPGQQRLARRATAAQANRPAAGARGRSALLLFFGLFLFGPALVGVIGGAVRAVWPDSEQVQPVIQGQEVSTSFGTFRVPSGWGLSASQISDETVTLTPDWDPDSSLMVSQASRVESDVATDCRGLLDSADDPVEISGSPLIDGQQSVGFRGHDAKGATVKAYCAQRNGGMIGIVGTTQQGPTSRLDSAMNRVASTLH